MAKFTVSSQFGKAPEGVSYCIVETIHADARILASLAGTGIRPIAAEASVGLQAWAQALRRRWYLEAQRCRQSHP